MVKGAVTSLEKTHNRIRLFPPTQTKMTTKKPKPPLDPTICEMCKKAPRTDGNYCHACWMAWLYMWGFDTEEEFYATFGVSHNPA